MEYVQATFLLYYFTKLAELYQVLLQINISSTVYFSVSHEDTSCFEFRLLVCSEVSLVGKRGVCIWIPRNVRGSRSIWDISEWWMNKSYGYHKKL